MEHVCQQCQSIFPVSEADLAFYRQVSPVLSGVQFAIPAPRCCPDCRFQRRLAYRNEFSYHSRECGLCRSRIISVFDTEAPFPVYCHKCWWGEGWDPLQYGKPFDTRRSFFEQFVELRNQVPQLAMMNDDGVGSENSQYCQDISNCKDCYLLTGSWFDQDCFYSTQVNYGKDVLDCFVVSVESELVYESTHSQKLYHCSFLSRSAQCSGCHFGFDLRGCTNCIGCVGLRQKHNCIFNEEKTPEEYEQQLRHLRLGTVAGQTAMKLRFEKFRLGFRHRAACQTNCENCTGDSLFNCREFDGFGMINGEWSKFVYLGDGAVHSYDVMSTGGPQWCLEGITPDNSYETHFTTWCWKDKQVLYSDNCHSSAHLFGCIGLKRNQYCILNKQYSPAEYAAEAAKVYERMMEDGEWGEFFPAANSPFGYNETRAQDIFPLTRAEVQGRGYRWKEIPTKHAAGQSVPLGIEETGDSILEQVLRCETCHRGYRIIRRELEIYRYLGVPVPANCPDCRRQVRFSGCSSTGKLFPRSCAVCALEIASVYAPDRPEKVVCENCYLDLLR